MKNITARKLRQVPEGYLIVGVDTHKKKHAVVIKTQDAIIHDRVKVDNSRRGFTELLERVKYRMNTTMTKGVMFAIEAGGRYWRPLAYYLDGNGIPFRLVSPFTLKRRREGDDIDRRKNDYHDAETAGELLRTGAFTETRLAEGSYALLREAYHTYYRLGKEITRASNLLGSLLDGIFPEFYKVFPDIDCKTALAVLEAYPLPETIAAMTLEDFRSAMLERCKGRRVVRKKLALIHEMACDTIGIRAGSGTVANEILMVVERLHLLQRQKENTERLIISIEESLPESKLILSIDGIGRITVAGILGELGPIQKYSNARQLVKMAGINPMQSESAGKNKGRTPMSKKGRPLLRHCLWEACSGLIRCNAHFKSWFEGLVGRPLYNHPLNRREARGAMCRKLLHLVFALINNGTFYKTERKISILA
jgi:transposase